jgi:hypothetical protein
MIRAIHVLSVGSLDLGSMVHDALLEGPGFQVSIAMGYLDLCAMHEHGDFQLAILHNTLESFELEDACRFIRHRWPRARILVVRAGEDFLEDALYDDRVIPPVVREILIATFKQLTATWSREGATPAIQGTVKAPNLIG